MKILHFKKYFLHDTETFIFNQIINLKNVENYVVCSKLLNSSNFDYKKIKNVKEIPNRISWNLQKYIFAILGILGRFYTLDFKNKIDYLKRVKPDIIHAHFGPNANYILPVKHKLNIPIATSFYGYDLSSFPKEYLGLAKRAYKKLISNGDIFIAMSQDMKNDLINLGFPQEKIRVHHFGINVSYFSSRKRNYVSNNGTIYLLQIASLMEKKGHIYLLKAMNKIVNNYKKNNIKVNIIGNGPLENELRIYVEKNNLENNVNFIGFIPISEKYIDYYLYSHIFVHHSVTDRQGAKEGIPTTILEAMATGLPVISTKHAGIKDVIQHEKNGYMTEERDVDSLVKYILGLAEDSELRKRIGQNGKMFVFNNYDIKKKSEELRTIYTEVLIK